MKKILIVLSTLLFMLTSCSDNKKCSDCEPPTYPDFAAMILAEDVSTTPRVLEAIGGKVPVTIDFKIPAQFMYAEAVMTVVPVLRWNGGEAISTAYIYKGELVEGNGTVISFESGGPATIRVSFDYVPQMAKSELYLTFEVKYQERTTPFELKIADGVIATSA